MQWNTLRVKILYFVVLVNFSTTVFNASVQDNLEKKKPNMFDYIIIGRVLVHCQKVCHKLRRLAESKRDQFAVCQGLIEAL